MAHQPLSHTLPVSEQLGPVLAVRPRLQMSCCTYLKVLKATGEVQDVPEISLGVPTGTRGLSQLQLLSDRIELQGPDGKDLAGPQELFSCNSHTRG